jgi:hypothetical protein
MHDSDAAQKTAAEILARVIEDVWWEHRVHWQTLLGMESRSRWNQAEKLVAASGLAIATRLAESHEWLELQKQYGWSAADFTSLLLEQSVDE